MCALHPCLCPGVCACCCVLTPPLQPASCDPHSDLPNRKAVLESCFSVELIRMSAITIARQPSRYKSDLQEHEADRWVSVSV